jgi:hypothetical protein
MWKGPAPHPPAPPPRGGGLGGAETQSLTKSSLRSDYVATYPPSETTSLRPPQWLRLEPPYGGLPPRGNPPGGQGGKGDLIGDVVFNSASIQFKRNNTVIECYRSYKSGKREVGKTKSSSIESSFLPSSLFPINFSNRKESRFLSFLWGAKKPVWIIRFYSKRLKNIMDILIPISLKNVYFSVLMVVTLWLGDFVTQRVIHFLYDQVYFKTFWNHKKNSFFSVKVLSGSHCYLNYLLLTYSTKNIRTFVISSWL